MGQGKAHFEGLERKAVATEDKLKSILLEVRVVGGVAKLPYTWLKPKGQPGCGGHGPQDCPSNYLFHQLGIKKDG